MLSYKSFDILASTLELELKKRNIELPSLDGRQRIAGSNGRGWCIGLFSPDLHQPYIEEMQKLLNEANAHQTSAPPVADKHVCPGGWCWE